MLYSVVSNSPHLPRLKTFDHHYGPVKYFGYYWLPWRTVNPLHDLNMTLVIKGILYEPISRERYFKILAYT